MKRIKPWLQVLLFARELPERFTSSELGAKAGISTATASAWLSEFYHWGYALRVEKVTQNGRWAWHWRLTKWGREYKGRSRVILKVAANPNPHSFDEAMKAFPTSIVGGLDQPKTISDLVYQAMHEIDMFEEGQDGAISAREAKTVRAFIQKYRTTEG